MAPTTGGEMRNPSRSSQPTIVRPVPGLNPGSSSAACMAAGIRVATPKPATPNPTIVPTMLGNASAAPMPTSTRTPPSRAMARWPKRSTMRSPSIRPMNCMPWSEMKPRPATNALAPRSPER